MTLLLLISLLLSLTLVSAEEKRLAECPKNGEGVIGNYYNNGKKCIRDKIVIDRESLELICPPDMEYKTGFCRTTIRGEESNGRKKSVKPTCPDGYETGFGSPPATEEGKKTDSNDNDKGIIKKKKMCLKMCPMGYAKKNERCILPKDILSVHFMYCPNEGDHRLDAYCTSTEIECKLTNVRGYDTLTKIGAPKFRYRDFDGLCERPKQVITREYKTVPRKTKKCPNSEDELVITSNTRVCQKPCPSSSYTAKKGKCVLPKCLLKPKDIMFGGSIHCPEGDYGITSHFH